MCFAMIKGEVIIAVNTAWNLVNFRSGLIRALIDEGYSVIAVAPEDRVSRERLEALGCRFHAIPMESRSTSVLGDLAIFRAMFALLRRERPLAYLGYTIKPNVYGSLAARLTGVPTINNISGLGTGFMRPGLLNRIVRILYRRGLAGADTVFFQNADDRELFIDLKLVRPEVTALLPGSGIDLTRFSPLPLPGGHPVFLLIARLLYDKGIAEFVEAARAIKAKRPEWRFRVLGFLDVDNRTAVPRSAVDEWVAEGLIEYRPPVDDVRPEIGEADVVVLPSYREGTSRVLLEAAAMARPLVTTDVPGCREVVDDGITGRLCSVRDAASLEEAMLAVGDLSAAERAAMGSRGRSKVEREYSEKLVIEAYVERLTRLSHLAN